MGLDCKGLGKVVEGAHCKYDAPVSRLITGEALTSDK